MMAPADPQAGVNLFTWLDFDAGSNKVQRVRKTYLELQVSAPRAAFPVVHEMFRRVSQLATVEWDDQPRWHRGCTRAQEQIFGHHKALSL